MELLTQITNRIELKPIEEVLDAIDNQVLCENRKAVVFSNGISEHQLKRILALHILKVDTFDWRSEHNLISEKERAAIEDNVAMMLDDMAEGPLTVIQDSLWYRFPVRREIVEKVLAADVVLEIDRPYQNCINILATEIEDGASAEELFETFEALRKEATNRTDKSRKYSKEYEHTGILLYGLFNADFILLLSRLSVPEESRLFYRDLLGLNFFPVVPNNSQAAATEL